MAALKRRYSVTYPTSGTGPIKERTRYFALLLSAREFAAKYPEAQIINRETGVPVNEEEVVNATR